MERCNEGKGVNIKGICLFGHAVECKDVGFMRVEMCLMV